jgi:O-succinylbenzoic acid--CoA ligase
MYPERPALVTAEGSVSYRELLARARAAAGALAGRGVSPGNRVALALQPGVELVVALHGCLLVGAAAVPIDLRLRDAERAARVAGAAVLVDEALDGGPPIGEVPECSLDRVATVVYTSGTTGRPRAVSLTYGNWLANAQGSAIALGLDLSERWLCALPLSHVGGLSILMRSVVYGTTAVLHPSFEVGAVLGALTDASSRVTLVSLVPTMLARLLDAGLARPPALRWALLGGGPIAPALLRRADAAGVPVAPTYGMTEACSQIVTFGWPLVGAEVRLGGEREVLVRGPMVASVVDDEGWLHTGDLGAWDPHGRLEIVGRKSDVIVTGGENVSPVEVEAVLLEHEAVLEAAVYARPDAEWGEAVVARVVLRDGVAVDGGELRAWCRARLAGFKVPKAVEFAEALPRTETGKLLRREL